MNDVMTRVSGVLAGSNSDWQHAVRRINESCTFTVRDICAVIGNPVEGVIVPARPDVEKTYRNAVQGG